MHYLVQFNEQDWELLKQKSDGIYVFYYKSGFHQIKQLRLESITLNPFNSPIVFSVVFESCNKLISIHPSENIFLINNDVMQKIQHSIIFRQMSNPKTRIYPIEIDSRLTRGHIARTPIKHGANFLFCECMYIPPKSNELIGHQFLMWFSGVDSPIEPNTLKFKEVSKISM